MAAKKESGPHRVKRTRWFLHDAFADYLAARVLLLRGLLKQAAILSSTAVEKCAKAVLVFHGNVVSPKHLKTAHANVLRREPRFGHLLNLDFITLNQRAYKLRYTDGLPIDFNLAIASREFLAEMDQTILTVLSCFKIDEGERHRPTGYETAIQKGDEHLIAENHIISRISSQQFISAKPQFVYEVRRHAQRGLVEATYMTAQPARAPGFLRMGLPLAKDSTEGFETIETTHFPIARTYSLLVEGSELVGGPFPPSTASG